MMADRTELARNIAKELRNRAGNESIDSPWYCIATCSFVASNFGLGVVQVYLVAIEGRSPSEARVILRRIKESLLKCCYLFGIPRMLNAFYPLSEAIPGEEYVDLVNPRENIKNPLDTTERGMRLFRNVYRDQTDKLLEPYKIAPELQQAAVIMEYGMYLSEFSILNPVETSQVLLASLIPLDVPTQVKWHMRGLIRNGGNDENLKYVVDIASQICRAMDVILRTELPPLSVAHEEQ